MTLGFLDLGMRLKHKDKVVLQGVSGERALMKNPLLPLSAELQTHENTS